MYIAIIGDIHKAWDDFDVAYFNQSSCDALLFMGDLPGRSHRGTDAVAAELARVTKPAYFMPGNHDGVTIGQFMGELRQNEKWIQKYARRQAPLCDSLQTALGDIVYTGYSRHDLEVSDERIHLVAARPHSMGGATLAFAPYLKERYGVASLEDSADRIEALFDECDGPIVVFSHNGPAGLGAERDAIWGCDFTREGGDFGDSDLAEALRRARSKNKQIVAVIAGHMHHRLKGGGERRWFLRDEHGTAYINAARVPRILRLNGERRHHHVALRIENGTAAVTEILAGESGFDLRNPAE
ncbi:MAG: metallophosphoesterase [bacterium]|nr:metallophosphoesterase [bacterium]